MRSGSTRAWTSSSCRSRCELDWARGSFARGAQHDHAAAGEEPVSVAVEKSAAQAARAVIARRLEAELKKARILELYLNVIEWGDGIYGAEAAARTYFHKSAAELGPPEAALLAGAIVNPRVMNPAHPSPRLLQRQQLILQRMGAVARHLESAQLER